MFMPLNAHAQRIRDMSMSEQESFSPQVQQGAPGAGLNNDIYQQYLSSTNQQPVQLPVQPPVAPATGLPPLPVQGALPVTAGATTRFMAGYCDPNFRPLMAQSARFAGMESCLQQQKQEACATFDRLPADVQLVLDGAINCMFDTYNVDIPAYAQPQAARDCSAEDTRRIQMLKKYWQDQYAAYALVFLPDQVLDMSGRCARR